MIPDTGKTDSYFRHNISFHVVIHTNQFSFAPAIKLLTSWDVFPLGRPPP